MSDNFTINERLHRYFDGELEPAQAAVMERELAASATLQEELQNLRIARYGLLQLGMKNRIAGIHREMMDEMAQQRGQEETPVRTVKKSKWWMIAAAAAAVTLLLLLTVFQQKAGGSLTAGDMFAANYRAYETTHVRGNAGAIENAYIQKQYGLVIELYNGMPQPGVKDKFFTACAYLETGDAAKASTLYGQVISANKSGLDTGYLEDAEYYQAMAYLKLGNIAAARFIFQTINNNKQHLYSDKVNDAWMLQLEKLK